MQALITPREVAEKLNKPVQAIQAWIRHGSFPGGYCYKREGCQKYTYEISRKIFEETFGGSNHDKNC